VLVELETGLADRDADRLRLDDAAEFTANGFFGFGGDQLEAVEQRSRL